MTKPEKPTHMDVPLPDGSRVMLPLPAYGLACKMGMALAQMSDEERQAFNVVCVSTEKSVLLRIMEMELTGHDPARLTVPGRKTDD